MADDSTFDKEPVAVVTAAVAVVDGAITTAVAIFGGLDASQVTALTGFAATVGAFVSALLIRARVYSPATHKDEVAAAYVEGAIREAVARPDVPPPAP
jgi:hypothetical protein